MWLLKPTRTLSVTTSDWRTTVPTFKILSTQKFIVIFEWENKRKISPTGRLAVSCYGATTMNNHHHTTREGTTTTTSVSVYIVSLLRRTYLTLSFISQSKHVLSFRSTTIESEKLFKAAKGTTQTRSGICAEKSITFVNVLVVVEYSTFGYINKSRM